MPILDTIGTLLNCFNSILRSFPCNNMMSCCSVARRDITSAILPGGATLCSAATEECWLEVAMLAQLLDKLRIRLSCKSAADEFKWRAHPRGCWREPVPRLPSSPSSSCGSRLVTRIVFKRVRSVIRSVSEWFQRPQKTIPTLPSDTSLFCCPAACATQHDVKGRGCRNTTPPVSQFCCPAACATLRLASKCNEMTEGQQWCAGADYHQG